MIKLVKKVILQMILIVILQESELIYLDSLPDSLPAEKIFTFHIY